VRNSEKRNGKMSLFKRLLHIDEVMMGSKRRKQKKEKDLGFLREMCPY
jgi:hypothetical protein